MCSHNTHNLFILHFKPQQNRSMRFISTCIFFSNVFIEFRYRSRIWTLISGIPEFDHIVCSNKQNCPNIFRSFRLIVISYFICISVQIFFVSIKIQNLGAKLHYNFKIIVKITYYVYLHHRFTR